MYNLSQQDFSPTPASTQTNPLSDPKDDGFGIKDYVLIGVGILAAMAPLIAAVVLTIRRRMQERSRTTIDGQADVEMANLQTHNNSAVVQDDSVRPAPAIDAVSAEESAGKTSTSLKDADLESAPAQQSKHPTASDPSPIVHVHSGSCIPISKTNLGGIKAL